MNGLAFVIIATTVLFAMFAIGCLAYDAGLDAGYSLRDDLEPSGPPYDWQAE